jgi:hypothetical protein
VIANRCPRQDLIIFHDLIEYHGKVAQEQQRND